MSKADPRTVDIGDLPIEAQVPLAGQVLGGKGFMDFEQFEVPDPQPGASLQIPDGRHRAEAHHGGFAPAVANASDARHWGDP